MESVDGDIVKAINEFGLINYLESWLSVWRVRFRNIVGDAISSLKKKLLLKELQLVGTSSHDALQATSSAALEWTQVLSIPRPIYEIIMHLSAAHSLN